ncbi:hypothetical protein DO021_15620 [Desulfobacter hydrogenophilus]|uniref:Uncharacterized protein n=1 Tax=Desulfobacter hydrogenophilus TaxID=2291 RepID=A0A328F8W1_9BACT|nr:hypothetical protein [Desulfobacter hydrogenophilus]NDY73110.1 hypothetical protein [Desulfobacter hydrogenophilus]QBH13544.1 hypothetical protein EYB58_11775 [Desulfobacter hydrogenophilus]RAM01114.1 hypothetical protein DO021_15620 [Desulfobacter hydrogenophilus]
MEKITCSNCGHECEKSKMPTKIEMRETMTVGTLQGKVYSCPKCGKELHVDVTIPKKKPVETELNLFDQESTND